ncbi:MAG: hypothetical protein AB9846_10290 [Tenuifilaceae bacterium]
MKKLIYISGIISVNLMLFGALFKALHIAGAGILLPISIFLFSFFFLPLALYSSYNSLEEKEYKWLYIVTGIVFSIELLAVLFKILHWPGAGIMMIIGIPLPFVLFLPFYLYQTRKNKNKSAINNMGIMFGLNFLAVFSALLTLNVSSTLLNKFAINSHNNEKFARFSTTIAKNNPNQENIKIKAEELCEYIDVLKCEILTATQNNLCENGKVKIDYNPIEIVNQSSTNLPIFSTKIGESQSKVDILKGKINEYRETVLATEKVCPELKELSNSLFDTSDREIHLGGDVQKVNWLEREFPNNNLSIVLNALSRIQSEVRFIESECLLAL